MIADAERSGLDVTQRCGHWSAGCAAESCGDELDVLRGCGAVVLDQHGGLVGAVGELGEQRGGDELNGALIVRGC